MDTFGTAKDLWVSDSGATYHFTGRRDWLQNYQKYPEPRPIYTAGAKPSFEEGEETVTVSTLMNGKWETKDIEKVSYIPKCKVNLFSEIVMVQIGYTTVRTKENTEYYSGPEMKAKGPQAVLYNNAYVMCFRPFQMAALSVSTMRLHLQTGHVNPKYVLQTAKRQAVHALPEK